MLEIDPTGLTVDVRLPLVGVLEHGRAAGVVELVDAHLLDLIHRVDAQFLLRLEFGRQTVGVPAEHAVDLMALHGLVARDDVLGIAGQQVAVVRQAVGKRRAVEEHEFVLAVVAGRTAVDGLLESVVLIPVVEHGLLQLGEAGVRRDVGALLAGSSLRIHMIGGFAHRMLLVWRFHYLPYEDDGFRAIAHVRHRGTTSLAALPCCSHAGCPPAQVSYARLTFGCSGRPRRFY